jgi:hypothetical protein
MVHKTLKTQEEVLKDFEKKYANILKPQHNKGDKNDKQRDSSRSGGVLV